jgi:hypothetical protein
MTLPFEILRLIMCAVRRDFKTRQASLLGLPCVQQFAVSLDRADVLHRLITGYFRGGVILGGQLRKWPHRSCGVEVTAFGVEL